MRGGILEKGRTRGLSEGQRFPESIGFCYLVVFIPDNAFFL